jgi:hypothetical protein
MSTEYHQGREVPDHRGGRTEEYSFDELAKGLASGTVSRGRALKLMGGALLGGVLAAIPGVALAQEGRPPGVPPPETPPPETPPTGAGSPQGEQGCPGVGQIRVRGECQCPTGTTTCGNACCPPDQACSGERCLPFCDIGVVFPLLPDLGDPCVCPSGTFNCTTGSVTRQGICCPTDSQCCTVRSGGVSGGITGCCSPGTRCDFDTGLCVSV